MRLYASTPEQLCRWLDEAPGVIALDTETTGLSYVKLEPVGFSLAYEGQSCYANLWENEQAPSLVKLLMNFLSKKAQLLILHHAPFDLKVLYKMGLRAEPPVFCTRMAAFLLDENRPSYRLKNLADPLLGEKNLPNFQHISEKYGYLDREFWEYGIRDAELTWRLYRKLLPKLRKQSLYNNLFRRIEMPFQYVLRDLAIKGVQVDAETLSKMRFQTKARLLKMEKSLYETARLPVAAKLKARGIKVPIESDSAALTEALELVSTVNFNSSKQLASFLRNDLGLELKLKTEKGQPSTSKHALNLLDHPFVDKLKEYGKIVKLYTTFLVPTEKFLDSDGRVRAEYVPTGTVTGRLSCRSPNLQQLPADGEYRNIFVAPPGKLLVVGDFSGQEMRVLAEVSRCKELINAFRNKYDLHLYTANKIFNLNLDKEALVEGTKAHEKAKETFSRQRFLAKNGANFPIIYGSTPAGIAKNLQIPLEQARRLVDGFFSIFPGAKTSMAEVRNTLEDRLMVTNKSGRKRRFDQPITRRAFRQAYNFLVQGLAADITKVAATKVRRLCRMFNEEWDADASIVMLVHDEIVVEVKDEFAERFAKLMKSTMQNAYRIVVPLPVEVGLARRYGQAK